MRNRLDTLASQKPNSAFNPSAVQLFKDWRTQYDRFMKYKKTIPNIIAIVEEVKTTLAGNPRGQLSAERVQHSIDRPSLNRWKKELSKQEIDKFLKAAGGRSLFE